MWSEANKDLHLTANQRECRREPVRHQLECAADDAWCFMEGRLR